MGSIVATTKYSIPRWRYVDSGDGTEPERCLFRQAKNAELGSRAEIRDGDDWRPLRPGERFIERAATMPQVDNDWVR